MNALFRAAVAAGCRVRRQTLAAHIVADPARRARTHLSLTRTGYQLNLEEGLEIARELHATQAVEAEVTAARRSVLHHRFYKPCVACGGLRHVRRRRCPDCGEGRVPVRA